MRTRLTAIVAIVGLSLAATLPAMAQAGHRHRYYRHYVQPHAYAVPALACRAMCPQDLSPCDPIYFKTADGRCAGIRTR
ncbi:MAG: hypothetical protein HYS06_02020 [Methylocystis sp.]|nr:hypothetical protein [Methylocystis sp.]MBI3275528.1 hypothetical protein [Methylocystis sp.]